MAKSRRIERINSLLKQVLAEVIANDLRAVTLEGFVSVMEVRCSKDLRIAHVDMSVFGVDDEKRHHTISLLNKVSGLIAVAASKKIRLRYFPSLEFQLDHTAEKHARIATILNTIGNDSSCS